MNNNSNSKKLQMNPVHSQSQFKASNVKTIMRGAVVKTAMPNKVNPVDNVKYPANNR